MKKTNKAKAKQKLKNKKQLSVLNNFCDQFIYKKQIIKILYV